MTLEEIKTELREGREVCLPDGEGGWIALSKIEHLEHVIGVKKHGSTPRGRAQQIIICHKKNLLPKEFKPGAAFAVADVNYKHNVSSKQLSTVDNVYNKFCVARKLCIYLLEQN